MNRLSVVDEMFLRAHRGMGTPIVLQGLWRTAEPVETELLARVHEALRRGPLGRRVVRSRVPGARPRWVVNTQAHPLELPSDPIPVAALLDWADQQGGDLNPETGPGWRLAAAPLDDGGCVVALTCSHALADGRAVALAVDHALTGTPLAAPIAPQSDWADARRQWRTVLGGTARALRRGLPPRPTPVAPRRATNPPAVTPLAHYPGSESAATNKTAAGAHQPYTGATSTPTNTTPAGADQTHIGAAPAHKTSDGASPADPHTGATMAFTDSAGAGGGLFMRKGSATAGAALQIPVREWNRVAVARGGTANSLFVHLVADLLWASGFQGETIVASLPVDTRDEPRVDNDMAMTEVAIERADTPATLRRKARAAYEHRMTSPGGIPEELLQVIPDRWAYALAKGAGERDILCSNIGCLPDSLLSLGPHPCTGVTARAIHPGLHLDRLPRTRLSGYLTRIADTYTLALVSLDPDAIADSTALTELARAGLAELGLTPVAIW
ncbi:hypothetical protein LTV02_23440 [Nocardia yamanashiensis]|uniref:hypothetical protein n=1 Tax=Nocardia yamanashiensis TaxID=209247 RepID=UPI001E43BA27|nr:hypothetical protein [Nocardia yamanashiensis]UGT39046.1 hypothetical protein LTV02_23440 [Nocardia yamanashiensis]